jgi:hypothetical protein
LNFIDWLRGRLPQRNLYGDDAKWLPRPLLKLNESDEEVNLYDRVYKDSNLPIKSRCIFSDSIIQSKAENKSHKKRKRAVEKIPEAQRDQCSICLETITRTLFSITVPCKHHFCYHCIKKWSKTKQQGEIKCPLCNEKIFAIAYHIYSAYDYKIRAVSCQSNALFSSVFTSWRRLKSLATQHDEVFIMQVNRRHQEMSMTLEESNRLRKVLGLDPLIIGIKHSRKKNEENAVRDMVDVWFSLKTKEYFCSIEQTNQLRASLGLSSLVHRA